MVCFQISRQIPQAPSLPEPEKCNNSDNNHGLDGWTKLVIHVKYPEKSQYGYSSYYTTYKSFVVPRVLWLNKKWTMKEVHYKIFSFFRKVFKNWKELEMNKTLTNTIKFMQGDNELTWDQFSQLPVEEQYAICFPEMTSENADD